MLTVIAIPAFSDNYIWLMRHKDSAVVVDPGQAAPVLHYLDQEHLRLRAILTTHHHYDHVGGNLELAKETGAAIFAPSTEAIAGRSHPLKEGDRVNLPEISTEFTVLDIPGHTLGHIAYYGANFLFCGDTLFACGCGKLFEGTPSQMYHSLQKLAKLAPHTEVYCGHEYTLNNIRFAKTIEPENIALLNLEKHARALRNENRPTLPSSIVTELATNPFLRCHTPSAKEAASLYRGRDINDSVQVFAALRELKDQF